MPYTQPMKIFAILAAVLMLHGQSVQEAVNGKRITFSRIDSTHIGLFVALPSTDFTVETGSGVTLEYRFQRRRNAIYEITAVSGSEVTLTFNKSIAGFSRSPDNMTLNRMYFDPDRSFDLGKQSNPTVPYTTDPNSILIRLHEEGVYKLDYQYFKANGININLIPVDQIRLYHYRTETAIHIESGNNGFIDQDNEYILFYGEAHKNRNYPETIDLKNDPYDYESAYWLTTNGISANPPKRLYEESGLRTEDNSDLIYKPDYFVRTEHVEQNNVYAATQLRNPEPEIANRGFFHQRDYWLWQEQGARNITSDRFSVFPELSVINDYFETPDDSVEFYVMMTGSAYPTSALHKVEFKIGAGSYVYDTATSWRYSRRQGIRFKLPYTLLRNENTLEIRSLNENDVLNLNWVQVTFNSKFTARNKQLKFNAVVPEPHPLQGLNYTVFEYTVTGFTRDDNVILMKIGESVVLDFNEQVSGNQMSITFQDEIANQNASFIILDESQLKQPNSIEMNTIFAERGRLTDRLSNAEFLIISAEELIDKAEEYQSLRSADYPTEVVHVEQIYREFNDGQRSPFAIKRFIRYAYENWSFDNRLKYVLFMGDARRRYFEGNASKVTIPTFQFITQRYGIANSDTFYGYLYHSREDYLDFLNNPVMDIYIGRVPAESVNEADAYLQKVIEYQNAPPQKDNLFLSGNDYNFSQENRDLYTNKRVFVGHVANINNQEANLNYSSIIRRAANDPVEATNTVLKSSAELQAIFNDGLNYITFLGHGAGAIWGDINIMLQEDVASLLNRNKYPIISSYTCYIGAFDDYQKTLGEELLLTRNKGAIALLGASGVSLLYNQYMMGYYINEQIFKDKFTYGEAISLGKYKYFKRGGNYLTSTSIQSTPEHSIHRYFLLMEFNLLGDPSLTVKLPDTGTLTPASRSISTGQTLQFDVSNIPPGSYEATFRLTDYVGETLSDTIFTLTVSNQTPFSLTIPQLTDEDTYFVKGSLSGNGTVYNMGTRLSKNNTDFVRSTTFIGPSNTTPLPLRGGADYRVMLTLSKSATSLTARLRANRFDQDRFQLFDLTFTAQNDSVYISDQAFRIDRDITDVELTEIQAIRNSETVTFDTRLFDVQPVKYLLRPVENTFFADYTTTTDLRLGISYALSYKDTLRTYVDFYRQDSALLFLGTDTIQFTAVGENRTARLSVAESYQGQRSRYYARFYTDSVELELDTVNQTAISEYFQLPNLTVSANTPVNRRITLSNQAELRLRLNSVNFQNDTSASAAFAELVDLPAEMNLEVDRVLMNKAIRLTYLTTGFTLAQTDTSNVTFDLQVNAWRGVDPASIQILEFRDDLGRWVDTRTFAHVGADSTLTITAAQLFTQTSTVAIAALDMSTNYEVSINVEADGIPADSIHYSSLNPALKLVLSSLNKDYTVNPKNLRLDVVDAGGIEQPVNFSFSYSGINNASLTLIPQSSQYFDRSGDYRLRVTMVGQGRLIRFRKGEKQTLAGNQYSQVLRLNGNDNMTIYGNYPNPFGSRTIFPVLISSSSNQAEVDLTIKIYSIAGRLVKTLNAGNMQFAESTDLYGDPRSGSSIRVGINYISWDGRDRNGLNLANGVYFAKFILKSGSKTIEKIIKLAKLNGYN